MLTVPAGLTGREDELRAVETSLASRSGGALVFQGAFGSGKSTLLAIASRMASERGAEVIGARATEAAGGHAFGVGLALARAALADGGRSLLAGVVPDALDDKRATALVRTLATSLGRLADQRPLLVTVDDVHHADEPSLELLALLASPAGGHRVTVLAAGASGFAPPGLDGLARAAGGVRPLPPLATEVAEDFVERVLPPGPAVRRIVGATAGNPFLLARLTEAVARGESTGAGEPVPPRVVARVRAELQLLGEEALAVARAVAAIGRPAQLGMVAEVAGLDVDAADAAAGRLAAAGLLQGGPALALAQPLTAKAVATDSPPRESARLHTRAAELLRDGSGPTDEVAGHLLLADRLGRDWAVDTLVRATLRAREEGHNERAVEFGRRALEEPPAADARAAVVRELGLAEADAGLPEAGERLREAMELVSSDDDRTRCALRLGQVLMVSGDRAGAERLLARAIEESDGVSRSLVEELNAAYAVVKVNALKVDAHERVAALERLSPDYAGPIERSGLAVEAMTGTFMLSLDAERAIALCRRALAGGALLSEESAGGVTLRFVTGTLLTADALDLGLEVTEALVASERGRGSSLGVRTAIYSRAWQLMFLGRAREALASIEEALDEPPPDWAYMPTARAGLGLALLELDETERAANAVDLEPRPQWKNSILWPILAAVQVRVAHAQGRTADALALIGDLRETERITGARNPALLDRGALETLVLLQAGDADGARAVAERDLELAREWGAPRTLGVALRSLGLARFDADPAAAIELLRESRDVLEKSPSGLERTRTQLELGIALRRDDQRRAARDPLAKALDTADRLGLLALARRAREELKVVGARPRRTALSGVGALTPAEHRTATLAAQGLTNKQIAEELFVTVKAVEKHLGAVYGKLEIASRRELAVRLDEDDELAP